MGASGAVRMPMTEASLDSAGDVERILDARGADAIELPARGGTTTTGTASHAPSLRFRVTNAELTYKSDDDADRARLTERIRAAAAEHEGYIASEQPSGIIVRVPAERLHETLEALAKLAPVLKRSTRVEEVTAAYTDLSVRIQNARKTRDRLEALLQNAHDVKALLEVQKELATATEQLELLEGRMRLLENQIRLATIAIDFDSPARPGPIGWIFYGAFKAVKWLFVWD
jgi:hypothetical protein